MPDGCLAVERGGCARDERTRSGAIVWGGSPSLVWSRRDADSPAFAPGAEASD